MTHARIHNRTSLQIKLASWIMGTTNLRYVYQRTPCSVIKKDGTISFDLELLVRHKVIQDICQYAEFCHSSVTVCVCFRPSPNPALYYFWRPWNKWPRGEAFEELKSSSHFEWPCVHPHAGPGWNGVRRRARCWATRTGIFARWCGRVNGFGEA